MVYIIVHLTSLADSFYNSLLEAGYGSFTQVQVQFGQHSELLLFPYLLEYIHWGITSSKLPSPFSRGEGHLDD